MISSPLLQLARITLERYVILQQKPIFEELGIPLTASLKELRGVFVTLYDHSVSQAKILRGCIGFVRPIKPLYQALIDNTVNACAHDPRFAPVKEAELSHLSLEVNVLTVPRKITSYEEIRLGVDGIILNYKNQQAVFLPSVPIKYRWTLEETLSQLAQKERLPSDVWRAAEVRLEVFQSEIFSEAPTPLIYPAS